MARMKSGLMDSWMNGLLEPKEVSECVILVNRVLRNQVRAQSFSHRRARSSKKKNWLDVRCRRQERRSLVFGLRNPRGPPRVAGYDRKRWPAMSGCGM